MKDEEDVLIQNCRDTTLKLRFKQGKLKKRF